MSKGTIEDAESTRRQVASRQETEGEANWLRHELDPLRRCCENAGVRVGRGRDSRCDGSFPGGVAGLRPCRHVARPRRRARFWGVSRPPSAFALFRRIARLSSVFPE